MKQNIKYIILMIFSLTMGVCGTLIVNHYFNNNQIIEKTVNEIKLTESDTISSSVEKIYDAVVTVENFGTGNSLNGFGTGFVYKTDENYGYVLTNNHVVNGAKTIKILNNQGDLVDATLLGSDEYADLAVLRIDKKYVLQVATLGDSASSKIGDSVFTVGTPVDIKYAGTVTKGIIASTQRAVTVSLSGGGDYMMDVLQITAPINPGNSGGPLLNLKGEVIGINTLKLVENEIEGMGFAIPIEMVNSILSRLEAGEKIQRPYLGVSMINVSNDYQLYKYGIMLKKDYEYGVVVFNVESGSLAESMGLQKGDVVLKIDDYEIKDSAYFRYVLYKFSVGDTIKVIYERDGESKNIEIKLNKGI